MNLKKYHHFMTFASASYEYPFLFIGYSVSDFDIRGILLELNELSEAKPRSYLIANNITPAEIRLWESKKIHCIEASFEDFLLQLDTLIPSAFRILPTLKPAMEHPISKHFRVPESVRPSDSLITFLERDVDYIHKGCKTSEIDPRAFYKGYFVELSPIILDLDVKRTISERILSEVFLATEEEKTERVEFYIIKGHAGSGKTVISRRLAWDASTEFDKLCLLLRPSSYPEYEALAELFRLCNERIFLFVDPASDYLDIVEQFVLKARKDKLPLTIIGSERYNEWNMNCEQLEPYLNDSYEIGYLGKKEIEQLIHLLTKHKSLGYLAGKTFEEQKDALSKRAGRQLLVALHEATLGKPFSDIVLDEYRSIASTHAQSLYLTVCILHRLGVDTRAGLISRVHGIPFSMFKESLFKPLEFVVFALENNVIKDYVYRTRHSHVAEIVFERVLVDTQDRYDEYIRIISALDIDYNSDRAALKKLLNARQLIHLFTDPQMIRGIYSSASKRFTDDPMILQQDGIFEMKFAGGSLDKATDLLQKAYKNATFAQKKVIAHSLALFALKKANKATTSIEKRKYRDESRRAAQEIVATSISEHPIHTLIKIGLDELSELIDQGDEATIERKIRDVEKDIFQAAQTFPDSPFILDAEASFSDLIKKHPLALKALKKAFQINKRSPYIALRLSKMYEGAGELESGISVLKECLDANPSDKTINFKLAMMLAKSPEARNSEILHLLRRSFTHGDSNYAAQFWYARFLYSEGDFESAGEIFKKLAELNIDTRIKKEPRGVVKVGDVPSRYKGTILTMESSYGFIVRDGYQDRIFTHCLYTIKDEWKHLEPQIRVSFELAFNYRGPIALNIRREVRS